MLLKNGAFKAVPVSHQMVGSEGKERYAITFRLMEGDDSGKNVTFFGGFAGKGQEFTLQVIETCGWDPKKEPDFTTSKLEKEVIVVLADDTYTDKDNKSATVTRVKYVNPINGAPKFKEVVPPARAKSLAQTFREAYLANQSAGKQDEYSRPAPMVTPGPSQQADDDIPF